MSILPLFSAGAEFFSAEAGFFGRSRFILGRSRQVGPEPAGGAGAGGK